ncbi:MAG: signal peptidase I [Coriobacteriia bacterium]|nr:signal peptidase I [Coriobacteriia bacterium]
MIALAFLLAQGIKTFVVQPFVIPTGSMEPTIMTGDRVLAEKISLRFRDPRTGEIVVFDDPTGRHPQLIKRVIAIGGQTVDIQDGSVVVDGTPLNEQYVHGKVTDPGTIPLPITLAEDEVWLMGDNRPNSGDSRFMGPISESMVRGRAFSIYWPMDRISTLALR